MNDTVDGKNSHAWTPKSHNSTIKYIKCMLQRVLVASPIPNFPF